MITITLYESKEPVDTKSHVSLRSVIGNIVIGIVAPVRQPEISIDRRDLVQKIEQHDDSTDKVANWLHVDDKYAQFDLHSIT